MESERKAWYEVVALVRSLQGDECVAPGYYSNPDWTVRDLVAHLGTWQAEAEIQFERMTAGTYGGHEVDIDALNAALLEAMADQPWEVAWVQANAARTRMVDEWCLVEGPSDEAGWWIAKAAGEHYAEHLGRLRRWVAELQARRSPV